MQTNGFLLLESSQIYHGLATHPVEGKGAALLVQESRCVIGGGSEIHNCSGIFGGGIECRAGSDLTISGSSIISSCRAERLGGGIRANDGAVVRVNGGSRISNCSSNEGAGLHVAFGSTVVISDGCRIDGCSAVTGGMASTVSATVEIHGSSITACEAIQGGAQ